MSRLQRDLLSVAAAHNMEADAVEHNTSIIIHVPWSKRNEDGSFETGVESEVVSTMPDLFAALGY